MKKIRWIELFAEIKVNLVAFISISMFVCLGIGLFLGIQWGGVALGGAADKVFDENNMHDIEVSFPYGLTKNDLNKLKAMDGISDVETAYTAFASLPKGSSRFVVKFQSVTERIDVPYNIEGKLPKKKNEVAMLRFCADGLGIKVGDKIKFVHDASEPVDDSEPDSDGMEYLNSDTFTVTGLVDHPAYMSMIAGTLGSASIGSGDVDAVVFVDNSAFDIDKFQNGYPDVFIRCDELRGMSTFSSEYQDRLNEIVADVDKLGGKLGTARYNKLHDDAQEKIDDAQRQINDGDRQVADGTQQINDGEQEIADGKRKLDDAEGQLADGKRQLDNGAVSLADGQAQINAGRAEAEAAKREAEAKLADAKKKLDEGQAKYDEGKKEYDEAKKTYDEATRIFNTVATNYDAAVGAYNALEGQKGRGEPGGTKDALVTADGAYDPGNPETATAVDTAWNNFSGEYGITRDNYNTFRTNAAVVAQAYGIPVPATPDLLSITAPDEGKSNLEKVSDDATAAVDDYTTTKLPVIEGIMNQQVTINGKSYTLANVRAAINDANAALNDAKAKLDAAKKELDDGWAQYNAARAEFNQKSAEADAKLNEAQALLNQKQQEYNDAKALYEQKLAEYNSGKVKLADAERELEEAKQKLEDAKKELEDAKKKLANAQEKFEEMKEYEWFVFPRLENGGAQSIDMMTTIQGKMRWAMALLFVLVGLFVCYSAVSRLVNDQITQIGTKKAVGFREGEIGSLYYWFSGIAVLVGTILAALLAVFVVENIMNPVAAESQVLPPFPPHFSLLETIIGGLIELALILLFSWIAAHGMLKRNAIDLLNGDTKASSAKAHFWEKWKLWQKMSLFSQTVVNNCVNDTRRVVATLIGVTGCTALIVTAITLSNNVAKSYDRHYDVVYDFDTFVYLDTKEKNAEKNVTKALDKMKLEHATAHLEKLQVRQPNGYRSAVSFYVPNNNEEFSKLFHVIPDDSKGEGQADLNAEGVWISDTYAEHMHVKAGDEVTVTEATGQKHTFKVAGVFECYILRNEFVVSKKEYKKAFGSNPTNNVLLVSRGDTELKTISDKLINVKGYDAISDDRAVCQWAFDELAKLLNIVVLIYIILSALMAIVVLLNLDVMFVDEKKRELIVLMICGFSVKDAKAYIYRDSIVLTIIGIILGVLLGATMGSITVGALEPSYGFFLKGFNWLAAIVGSVASAVFAVAVLFWSLRRIPRFDLTDINRF